LCLGQRRLLAEQLLLEDLALAALGGGGLGRRLPREATELARCARRGLAGVRLLPRHDVDLPRHERALLAGGVALVARVQRPAGTVDALVDLRGLRAGDDRRRS